MKKFIVFTILVLGLLTPMSMAQNPHSVVLSWTASVVPVGGGAITGYKIYKSSVNGAGPIPANLLAAVAGGVLTYTDLAVAANEVWYYKVTAVCSTCSPSESGPSNQATATIPPDTFPQPAPPTNLTGVPK